MDIITVSQLNRSCKQILENEFFNVWVTGELSNFARPSSGHWYFTLKDDSAQVRCAMFRMNNQSVTFTPAEGMQLNVCARVSLYEARGDYQLIVNQLEEAGDGALKRAFERLKKKIEALGWFADELKKALPEMPKQIGLITSPTGAAIFDVLTTLRRRFPLTPVIIYPTQVQGASAAKQIASQIEQANQRDECDVLILTRGGGSLEDLWQFNEEIVAKAIYESRLPIISAIGHEVDITISDLIADVRAPTPTAAAELVSQDAKEISVFLIHQQRQLQQFMFQTLREHFLSLAHLRKRLRHPEALLRECAQRLDEQEKRLLTTMALQLERLTLKFKHCTELLDNLSPLSTLKRGYAICRKGNDVITRKNQVQQGDKLIIELSDGKVSSRVCQNNLR